MLKTVNLKYDFIASIVVFLVAIPLCLGIALASGAPIFAGILSGVIGGIVVGWISESQVSVSGPAAGMIAVVIAAISQLGGYQPFLLALFIAGFIQIAIGVLRAGFIADYVPSNVIQGLLAAIGVLIIVKQIPLAFGYFPQTETLQTSLKEAQGTLDSQPIVHLLSHIDPGAVLITLISLLVLIYWGKLKYFRINALPSAIVVVVLATLINAFFIEFMPQLALDKANLINLPLNGDFASLLANFKHPQFSQWTNPSVYLYAFMIAVIGSLETLLNLEAAEKLDKKHHYCSRNRELVAQGVGNSLAGLLGALPITSVIVRTSVNINAGGKSKYSTIFHGFLLLASLLLFPGLLNKIPVAALAAILIHTGYKLTNLYLYKNAYRQGFVYFFPFLVTVVAIIFTNLLLGIVIGLCTSIFFILRYHSKSAFTTVYERHPSGDIIRLILPHQVTFLNKAGIINGLKKLPPDSKVVIDAKNTSYIDTDILEIIQDFKNIQENKLRGNRNILLNLEGFKEHYAIKDQTNFIYATTFDVQENLSPVDILTLLKEGNQRFINSTPIHKNYKQLVGATAKSQHPIAVILGCIDSRVPVELIFDLSVGDVFVVRVAGNIANDDILASLEFACEIAKAKLIVVLGHTGCGAIDAACHHTKLGHLTQLVNKIAPALNRVKKQLGDENMLSPGFINQVTVENIELTKQYIVKHSSILARLIDSQKIGMVGALYDVASGHVLLGELSPGYEPAIGGTSQLKPSEIA